MEVWKRKKDEDGLTEEEMCCAQCQAVWHPGDYLLLQVISDNPEWINQFGWDQYDTWKTQVICEWSFAYALLITRVRCVIGMFHPAPLLTCETFS